MIDAVLNQPISKNSQLSALDAVAVAPKWHQVIYENDFLRILQVIVNRGETVPFHTHQWDGLMITLKDTDFTIIDSAGVNSVETALEISKLPFAEFIKGSLEPHSYINTGHKEFKAIVIEFKNKENVTNNSY